MADTNIHPVDLDKLRKRLERERACIIPGGDIPVAVSIDGSLPVYGTFHWHCDEPDAVTRFGQPDWRETAPPIYWHIEAEVHLSTFGAFSELRWGEVDKQLYSGTAHHRSTRAELGGQIKTLFKGIGPIAREEN